MATRGCPQADQHVDGRIRGPPDLPMYLTSRRGRRLRDQMTSPNRATRTVGALSVATPTSIVNLTVHGIGTPVRELDPGEDRAWVSEAQFEEVLDAVAGRPDVRVTFDDGNASDVEIALPHLLKRRLTGQFFLPAGLIGMPGRLDRDGVRELLRAGMTLGSHGWAHCDWRRLAPEQQHEELIGAPRMLEELAGRPVSEVALPMGSYDRHVLRRLRTANVTRVYTSDGGRARPDAWLQARTSLRSNIDSAWIARVIDGVPSLPRRARQIAARTVKRLRG
jgi:peptidoglycan/xylan/chitin deacetylase (PgdA/CDA1 family)